ncbi:amidohydrolase family protein [Geodermatophilus sp. SYSU D01062]
MSGRSVIRAARAFDGERALPGGAAVFVENDRIAGVEPAAASVPDGWPVHDFGDATVLPGLVDVHVHLCADGRNGALQRLPGLADDELAGVVDDSLRTQLAAGVTTVRDLGDRRWAVLDRRDEGTAGLPTIVASGPPITSVRGHCWHMGGEAAGPEQLRAAVAERAERGVDVVKVMASGGGTTPGTDVLACQFTTEELRLVVDAAHAAGLPVTVHAHALAAVEQALAAGSDGVEHCTCLTPDGLRPPPEVLAALVRRQVVVCPTLGRAAGEPAPAPLVAMFARAGLTPESGRAERLAAVEAMHRAGVVLVSGTDAGIGAAKPHGLLPDAIAELAECGFSPAEALASATSVPARHLGLAGRKGRLRPGLDADLLLVAGNPLTDPAALQRVTAVVVGGAWTDGRARPHTSADPTAGVSAPWASA